MIIEALGFILNRFFDLFRKPFGLFKNMFFGIFRNLLAYLRIDFLVYLKTL